MKSLHAQLKVKTNALSSVGAPFLNYEVKKKYTLTLTATDQSGAGLSVSALVDVIVINVNEAPQAKQKFQTK